MRDGAGSGDVSAKLGFGRPIPTKCWATPPWDFGPNPSFVRTLLGVLWGTPIWTSGPCLRDLGLRFLRVGPADISIVCRQIGIRTAWGASEVARRPRCRRGVAGDMGLACAQGGGARARNHSRRSTRSSGRRSEARRTSPPQRTRPTRRPATAGGRGNRAPYSREAPHAARRLVSKAGRLGFVGGGAAAQGGVPPPSSVEVGPFPRIGVADSRRRGRILRGSPF